MNRLLLLTKVGFILCGFIKVTAQPIADRCEVKTHEHHEKFETWMSKRKTSLRTISDKVYRLPVVVHIIHLGEPVGKGFNLSNEQIESQIRVLNEDFRRKEGTPGFNDHPDGGDARIEFVLARSDPNRKATDGIVRVDMTQVDNPVNDGNTFNYYAYYSYWPPEDYLNIWSVPDWPKDIFLGKAVGPETDLPGGGEFDKAEPTDGIIVNGWHFGVSDLDSPHNTGRTATHEIGHFLGLLHIWGTPGCNKTDYCEDTPPTDKSLGGCPTVPPLACDGQFAMIENYMDYTDDDCMNIFTNDQIFRMRTVLENSPRRKSLNESPGLSFPTPVPENPDYMTRVKVYPNPASHEIHIVFEASQGIRSLEIVGYTPLGKQVFIDSYDLFQENEVIIKLPQLKEKLLFIRIAGEGVSSVQKLILQ